MEDLSGEIEVHKKEKKRNNERENKKTKNTTLRSESLTTDNTFLNC
jgi:hypothetical protein